MATDERPDEPDDRGSDPRRLDEDAAWRAIVENYGEPALDDSDLAPPPDAPPPPAPASRDERLRGLFQPRWSDPLESEATWEDEGHFVPPTPPPVVVTDPRRRAAWIGLFGSPLVMLVSVVLGWSLPGWLMLGLTVGFVGGFVYLVATMPHRRDGDDGAVV